MKTCKIVTLLLAVFCFMPNVLPAQERVLHTPLEMATAGSDLRLECRLLGLTSQIEQTRLFYRANERDEYKFVFLQQEGDGWAGLIPGGDIGGNSLQYFIVFKLSGEKLVTWPEQEAQTRPEEIPVRTTESAGAASPVVGTSGPLLILSPEPDQIIEPGQVFLAISLAPDVVDTASVVITLDNRDVTPHVTRSEFVITYQPANLAPGAHRFSLGAKDKTGQVIGPFTQTFYVRGKQALEKPRPGFTGRVFSEARYEKIFQKNESFMMGGAEFNGRYGGLDVRGRIFLTSLEDGSRQPRDRFYMAVENHTFAMEAGDVYPRYNDLMIWGKRVRGLAGRLQTGVFEMQMVFGQTYRAAEGRARIDSNGVTLLQRGTFSQSLLGFRPGLNFHDRVKFGLSFLKIKDDLGSIKFGSRPKENIVFGPDLLLSFDKGRVELRALAALSALTYDIGIGAFSIADVKNMFAEDVNVPVDPQKYKKILIINDSTVPLDPRELTSYAYDVNLKLSYFRNSLRLGYKRIGSDYFSLANAWQRKDIRGFYMTDRLRLLQNKIYLNFGLERYSDNFSALGVKPATDLNSFNLALSYYPGKSLPNVSVSFRNYSRNNGITDVRFDSLTFIGAVDTTDLRENSRQRDVSIQLGYQANFWRAGHYFTLGYITAFKDDRFAGDRLRNYFPQDMSSNIYTLAWTSTYGFPLRTTVSFSTNDNKIAGGLSDLRYRALGLFGEYNVLRGKLATFAEARLTTTAGKNLAGAATDADRYFARLGATLHLKAQQTCTLELFFITFSSQGDEAIAYSTYTDTLIRARYEKLF